VTGSPDRAIADLPSEARRVRTESAAARRTRDRHLRFVEAAELRMAALVDAWCQRGDRLCIDTVSGSRCEGVISLVGLDAIAVGATLVPFSSIAAVHSCGDVSADRTRAERPSFAALLGSLAATRPLVRVGRPGGLAPIEAELRSAGEEILVMQEPGGPGSIVIPIAQVSELTVLASG
jgi:hypothetical protein